MVHRIAAKAQRIRRLGSFATAIAAAVVLLIPFGAASPAVAAPAEDPAVTSVSIVDKNGNPVTSAGVLEGVYINVGFTATPAATKGDFFQVAWDPAYLKGLPKTDFSVFDKAHPSRGAIAQCSVTSGTLLCTYTDYVDRYEDVSGVVNFSAQLIHQTESIEFTGSGDVEYSVGIIVKPPTEPGYTPPENLKKGGYTDWATNDITWNININPRAFPGVETIKVEDGHALGLTFKPQTWFIVWRPTGGTNWVSLTPDSDYVVSFDTPEHMFTVDIKNVPERRNGGYQLGYHTDVPGDVEVGHVFENTVTAGGFSDSMLVEWNINAGGNGSGSAFGTFTLEKRFATGSEAAGAEKDFSGDWTCEVQNPTETIAGTWSVTGAGLATLVQTTANSKFPKLPLGSICSATELPPGEEWLPGEVSEPVEIFDGVSELTVTNELASVPADPTGAFTITKTLHDEGGLAPADLRFAGTYSCTTSAGVIGPVRWELGAGEQLRVADLPVGAVCSATESQIPSVSGGTWAKPRVGDAVTIAVSNEPTIEVVNTLTPTAVALPHTPATPLPATGAGPIAATFAAGLALVIAGVVLATRRTRRPAH